MLIALYEDDVAFDYLNLESLRGGERPSCAPLALKRFPVLVDGDHACSRAAPSSSISHVPSSRPSLPGAEGEAGIGGAHDGSPVPTTM